MPVRDIKYKDFTIKDNYDGSKIVKINGVNLPGMLLIHANWCGHCTRFKPIYETLSNKLKDDFPLYAIEQTDLSKDYNLQTALNFKGYPTIKYFNQRGEIIGEYTGKRDIGDMLTDICKQYHKCYN